MVDIGDMLPDLSLVSAEGEPLGLRDFVGRPLVLYFYPKADTTGCTREAQDFSALLPAFTAAGAAVLGVSRDTPARLAKFAAKYGLAVPLASDEAGAISEAFGVWVEKQLYGKRYMGLERATFLFEAGGTLARDWRKVRVAGHAESVLESVRALG
ncbi:peroxiredoxin [Sphingomonas aracearum]|uniref:thioredoxin-dependent peroxiredoxin n=1 Tax=Sphingomonas aracearum TaxID=2283317 RepID=A0A369VYF1_9SPHN|nr:peroxiredoxin [Sphingomonas aracearum]RDE06655.1 peroxiredoxin [Sphingomonas aracearum]